jgi:hypothetical protein
MIAAPMATVIINDDKRHRQEDMKEMISDGREHALTTEPVGTEFTDHVRDRKRLCSSKEFSSNSLRTPPFRAKSILLSGFRRQALFFVVDSGRVSDFGASSGAKVRPSLRVPCQYRHEQIETVRRNGRRVAAQSA